MKKSKTFLRVFPSMTKKEYLFGLIAFLNKIESCERDGLIEKSRDKFLTTAIGYAGEYYKRLNCGTRKYLKQGTKE